MSAHSYRIVLPDACVLRSDISAEDVAWICKQLGYDERRILLKLKRDHRVILQDDVGKFVVQQNS
jgi:hypothetical protein